MTKETMLFCLIGDPVSHSLSPAMHNSAFSSLNIDAVYTTMLVRMEEVRPSLSTLRDLQAKGINVTMPHKKTVMEFLDKVDSDADKIGAVNTILNENGKLIGKNTDSIGAVGAIKKKIRDLRGKKAIILGKGGTARALEYGLEREGTEVTLLGREEMKGEFLNGLMVDVDLICNCSPLGMDGVTNPVPVKFLDSRIAVFDAVYGTKETPLISSAKRHGCMTIGGEEMLVRQGISSFELWTGLKPEERVMLEALRKERDRRSRRKDRNVYLTGFAGTGKSSLGKRLANELRMRFVDTDDEISRRMNSSIVQIFEQYGERPFREMENLVINEVSEMNGAVVSTGGGAVLDLENVHRMRDTGVVVLLKSDPESIVERLEGNPARPLLRPSSGDSILGQVKKMQYMREPYYRLARDLEIATDGKTVEAIARELKLSLGGIE